MSSSGLGVRGADPDGLAALTRLLELVADALDHVRAELRLVVDGLTIVPAIDRITEVSTWARDAANTARRVAVRVLSDGQGWRHRSLLDHVAGVAGSFGSGFVNGAGGIARGLWSAVETGGANTMSGAVAVWDAAQGDWAGVEREAHAVVSREAKIGGALGQSVVSLAEVQPWMFALHVHRDGFWRAADDWAGACGQQSPSLLLTAATAGAGAEAGVAGVVSDVADNIGNASYLDPRGVGMGAAPMSADDVLTMDFSVAVAGDPGHRVALDPRTGDFLVARSEGDGDLSVSEKRWSRLSDAERKALKDSTVVNGHGQLSGV